MPAVAQCPQLGERIGMKTILLVDDDQPVRTLYGLVLRRNGYRVLEADSGGAALDMARKHLPDLILSDIIIPGSDGVSLLRQIRDDPDLKARPFVLMSGSPDVVTSYKGIEAADDFLVKPIGLQELLNCIKTRFLDEPTYHRSTMREGTSSENGGSVRLDLLN
jgi:DNA-binding response OmpR family regulator